MSSRTKIVDVPATTRNEVSKMIVHIAKGENPMDFLFESVPEALCGKEVPFPMEDDGITSRLPQHAGFATCGECKKIWKDVLYEA